MKLLHVISSLSGGGAERQLSYLLPALAARGHEVHVAYLTTGPRPPDFGDTGVILHPIQHASNYDPRILLSLLGFVRRLQPDVVHSWIVQMDVLAGVVTRVTGVPWVFREASCEVRAAARGPKERCRRVVSRWARYIVANSRGGHSYWERLRPEIPKCVIMNGISSTPFKGNRRPRGERHGRVLFAGRLVPLKQAAMLTRAFGRFAQNLGCELTICGTGSEEPAIRRLCQQLGIEERVHLLGHVSQDMLVEEMGRSDLLVNPSLYEGCPNVVLEAMAASCPVAVSDIPAHRDILDEETALFFDPKDDQSLERALHTGVTEATQGELRARQARAKAEEFSIDGMAGRYCDVYDLVRQG